MAEEVLAGLLLGGLIGGLVVGLAISGNYLRRLNKRYAQIETAALESYVMRKHPKTWLQMSNPNGFQAKLEKELTKDFFNEKKENVEDRFVPEC